MDYILMPLDDVISILTQKGIKCHVVCNNNGTLGDTKLVTNVKVQNDSATVTYGEFLFNLKDSNVQKD